MKKIRVWNRDTGFQATLEVPDDAIEVDVNGTRYQPSDITDTEFVPVWTNRFVLAGPPRHREGRDESDDDGYRDYPPYA